jgi:O-methyltransferase
MDTALRARLRHYVPEPFVRLKRVVESRAHRAATELPLARFVCSGPASFATRWRLARAFKAIHRDILASHTHDELLEIVTAILMLPRRTEGALLEAGCFKGASAAKLSLVARLTGRPLILCDSFEGIPANEESHGRTLDGVQADFRAGQYRGGLDEVHDAIERHGDLAMCRFVKGWFEQTLPTLTEPIAIAFIDVDLASSTRTCLREIYPRLSPGGSLFSHDGHLPLCIEAMRDPALWAGIGEPVPIIEGLGTRKLVRITKPPVRKRSASDR